MPGHYTPCTPRESTPNVYLDWILYVILSKTVHNSKRYGDLDEKIIKFPKNPEPTHVYLGFHTVNRHFRIYDLLYGMLSKRGWVRDFIEISRFFHLNHHNFVTYEPFLKRIPKRPGTLTSYY